MWMIEQINNPKQKVTHAIFSLANRKWDMRNGNANMQYANTQIT